MKINRQINVDRVVVPLKEKYTTFKAIDNHPYIGPVSLPIVYSYENFINGSKFAHGFEYHNLNDLGTNKTILIQRHGDAASINKLFLPIDCSVNDIKTFQIMCGGCPIMIVPFSYILFTSNKIKRNEHNIVITINFELLMQNKFIQGKEVEGITLIALQNHEVEVVLLSEKNFSYSLRIKYLYYYSDVRRYIAQLASENNTKNFYNNFINEKIYSLRTRPKAFLKIIGILVIVECFSSHKPKEIQVLSNDNNLICSYNREEITKIESKKDFHNLSINNTSRVWSDDHRFALYESLFEILPTEIIYEIEKYFKPHTYYFLILFEDIHRQLLLDAYTIYLKFDKEINKNKEIIFIYENKFLNETGMGGPNQLVNEYASTGTI